MACGEEDCRSKELNLYAIETGYEEDPPIYVFAAQIREAISKYKVHIAHDVNNNCPEGPQKVEAADIAEPVSIVLVCHPEQVIF